MVVEDEYFLAEDLRAALEIRGVVVVRPVASDEDAIELVRNGLIDSGILDINLSGIMAYPLARMLKRRGIPFVFLTGYDHAAHDSGVDDVEMFRKPFTDQTLDAALEILSRR